ncbi:MAG: ATP-binding protein, partial [Firmicutes bacterium]|nr:ATP-binding protein [Bacillota bacterium]
MQNQLDIIWSQALKIIKKQLNTPTYKAWFENTSPTQMEGDTLFISAPNSFAKEWLESRYNSLITDALFQVLGEEIQINVVVDEAEQLSIAQDSQRQKSTELKPQQAVLNSKYTFESFVIGSSNRFAHAAALAVSEAPSKAYNPLFIYGGVGLGKTHLLHAIGHVAEQRRLNVLYVTSETFTNEFIRAIRDRQNDAFRERYRGVDVLLIDDIQFLATKEQTQEEFFHTFNDLHAANKQIVITSDRSPKVMP